MSADGVEVQVDFPVELRSRNVGGSDGAGLCVFTSIQHSALLQSVELLADFQAWMRRRPGGGYPDKVDRMIARKASEAGKPIPDYAQYEGTDLGVLRFALETGRMPSVTYNGRDPHYRGTIAHMVNLVHLDDRYAVVLDNNFIGENELVWMTPVEFKSRWCGGGNGWAVFLLAPPPPAPPFN